MSGPLIEVICLNTKGCASVVAGYGTMNPPPLDRRPDFHHVMLVPGVIGSLPRCPVCAEKSLTATPYPGPPPDAQAKFPLGACSMSPGIEQFLTQEIPSKRPGGEPLRMVDGKLRTELYRLTQAHARADWDMVGLQDEPDQAAANDRAIRPDKRVLKLLTTEGVEYIAGPYVLERNPVTTTPTLNGAQIVIVTEAGRHVTTAMLLEER